MGYEEGGIVGGISSGGGSPPVPRQNSASGIFDVWKSGGYGQVGGSDSKAQALAALRTYYAGTGYDPTWAEYTANSTYNLSFMPNMPNTPQQLPGQTPGAILQSAPQSVPQSAPMYPAGVQQVLSGRSIAPPFSLFRGAGLQIPSMQAQRNLLPSELAVYAETARLAGIPWEEYQRELASTAPGFGRRGPQFQWQRAPRMSYGYSGDWG